MPQITDEQILELIKMNARDFWTIAEENFPRFCEFNNQEKARENISMGREEFTSICITQFIELKRGKNFGAVPIHSNDDKKKAQDSDDKPDYTIHDPDSPMTDLQRKKIGVLLGKIPDAVRVVNQYLHNNEIKGGWDNATKGQASDIIKLLLKKEKEGGD